MNCHFYVQVVFIQCVNIQTSLHFVIYVFFGTIKLNQDGVEIGTNPRYKSLILNQENHLIFGINWSGWETQAFQPFDTPGSIPIS